MLNIINSDMGGFDELDLREMEIQLETGKRIRKIRTNKGMTQSELGALVGLSADRIQQYENGYRRPKNNLLMKIAEALKVSPLALINPVFNWDVSIMYALFELEETHELDIQITEDGKYTFSFDDKNEDFNIMLAKWHSIKQQTSLELKKANTENEKKEIMLKYRDMKNNFSSIMRDEIDACMEEYKAKVQKELHQ